MVQQKSKYRRDFAKDDKIDGQTRIEWRQFRLDSRQSSDTGPLKKCFDNISLASMSHLLEQKLSLDIRTQVQEPNLKLWGGQERGGGGEGEGGHSSDNITNIYFQLNSYHFVFEGTE